MESVAGKIGWGAWLAYLNDKVERGGNKPPLLYALDHPLAGIEYLLSLLGSALFWQQNLAFVAGLLLAGLALISLALIYGYGRLGANSFWVSLLLYSFLTLAAITMGRSGFGADQALSSRYATFSILAVVSVYAMLVKMTLERRTSLRRPTILTVLLVALSGAVLLSAAISYSKGMDAGNQERAFREEAAFALSTYDSQPDEVLASIRPRIDDVRTYAPILQRLGYNVFSEEPQALGLPPPLFNLSPIASSSPSAIDRLNSDANDSPKMSHDRSILVPKEASFIRVAGWAIDADKESAAGGVYIDVDDKLFLPAFYGKERQDVADSFGVESYRDSGFERYVAASEIGEGTHELSVVVVNSDGEGYYRPYQKVPLEIGELG
jgi:hypothetical protein